jgi:ATP-dependent Clp protease ATP-binding subunit ClpA
VFDRFTLSARKSISMASAEAAICRSRSVEAEHLILGLLHDPGCIAGQALLSCGLRLETARTQLRNRDDGSLGTMTFGVTARLALEGSLRQAVADRSDYIGPEHVLLAALECDESRVASILALAGTTPGQVRRQMIGLTQASQFLPTLDPRLVHEYHYDPRLVEDAVARVKRVFGVGGTEKSHP